MEKTLNAFTATAVGLPLQSVFWQPWYRRYVTHCSQHSFRCAVRSYLARLSGVQSIRESLRPVTYLDALCFEVVCRMAGGLVLSGEYRGMYLEKHVGGSQYQPKLVGTYESELQEALVQESRRAKTLIDVGSDDGYYAIGLARLNPLLSSIAVECDPERCRRIARNATRNGVADRLAVLPRRLSQGDELVSLVRSASPPVLLKCDIEGGEYGLLDGHTLAGIRSHVVALVIETHQTLELEQELCNRMMERRYCPVVVERRPTLRRPDVSGPWVARALCAVFAQRWQNEGRPGFNRWIVATGRQG